MDILYIALLTIFAAGVGTITGFGTSTILIPILIFFFPLPQALLLVGIIHWFGDVWKITLFRQGVRWKLLLAFGLPGAVATYVGASLIFVADKLLLLRILGTFLIIYSLFLFIKSSFKIPSSILSVSLGGTASGFFAGVFGIGGAIRGMFLSAFNLPKEVYISTAGAAALIIDSTRLTTYILGGIKLDERMMWGLLLFIPASLLGAKLAKMIVDKIPQQYFRYVICAFLFLIGVKFIVLP